MAINHHNLTKNESLNPCYPFYYYYQLFEIFCVPVIIAVGFIGNILSCLVLLTTQLKLRSSSYYLAALAISDFGFLITVLVLYLGYQDIYDLYNKAGFCEFFIYLSSVCAFISVWLTVAFTTERFIAVKYPLQRQYICTVSRAKTIVFTLVCLALLCHLYLFWMAGSVENSDNTTICKMVPTFDSSLANIINISDTVFTLIIPVILIISFNIMIAKVIFRSPALHTDTRFRFDAAQITCTSFQGNDSAKNLDPESSVLKDNNKCSENFDRCSKKHGSTSKPNQHNITKMLFIISSVFVALNFPSYMVRILIFFHVSDHYEYLFCIQKVSQLLYYMNFSINFILYTVCGKPFRLCLKKMFQNWFKKLFKC